MWSYIKNTWLSAFWTSLLVEIGIFGGEFFSGSQSVLSTTSLAVTDWLCWAPSQMYQLLPISMIEWGPYQSESICTCKDPMRNHKVRIPFHDDKIDTYWTLFVLTDSTQVHIGPLPLPRFSNMPIGTNWNFQHAECPVLLVYRCILNMKVDSQQHVKPMYKKKWKKVTITVFDLDKKKLKKKTITFFVYKLNMLMAIVLFDFCWDYHFIHRTSKQVFLCPWPHSAPSWMNWLGVIRTFDMWSVL